MPSRASQSSYAGPACRLHSSFDTARVARESLRFHNRFFQNPGATRMKQTSLTLAALCLAGAASAQSSVTLYGTVDVGLSVGHGDTANRTQVSSGNTNTSRIGFRGREDLGGGMFAGFMLEGGLLADSGLGLASNTNNQATGTATAPAGTQGLTFARESYLDLGGSWGTLRLGRTSPAHYRNRIELDPFTNIGVGASQATTGSLEVLTRTRVSNMVKYMTPDERLGGFFGMFDYYLGENLSNAVNKDDGNGFSSRVGYKAGPWLASVAYGVTKYSPTATAGDVKVLNIGGTYSLARGRVMAGWYRDRVESTVARTAKGYILAFEALAGPHALRGSYSRYGTDASGHPTTNKLAVGYLSGQRTKARPASTSACGRRSDAAGVPLAVSAALRDGRGLMRNGLPALAARRNCGTTLGVRVDVLAKQLSHGHHCKQLQISRKGRAWWKRGLDRCEHTPCRSTPNGSASSTRAFRRPHPQPPQTGR